MIIIYVCHNQQTVDICIKKCPHAHIMLVGPETVVVPNKDTLTIVRDLPHNIEHERKLLTFTAWYAIIKNNLFPNEDMLCVLEWDVNIPPIETFSGITQDVGVFFVDQGGHFLCNVNADILKDYILLKRISYPNFKIPWGCTTNYVIRRSILEKFVDIYYPSCIEHIKLKDNANFSWYHERVFWVFLTSIRHSEVRILGAKHIQASSHRLTINR